MDATAFLAQVQELLPQQLFPEDIVVTAVRPAGGRPWPRAEAIFRLVDPPSSWSGPTTGSAYLPLAQEWRDASGYDPSDYALLLASEVEAAAVRAFNPPPPSPPLTPEQVSERWQWLLERLALSGPVRQVAPSRLVVRPGAESSFTVLVSPEEWAQIATPVEPDADDPQDFSPHDGDEIYLVFYEDHLAWSIRPELPPVRGGAELRRKVRAAVAQGKTNTGWFAYHRWSPNLPASTATSSEGATEARRPVRHPVRPSGSATTRASGRADVRIALTQTTSQLLRPSCCRSRPGAARSSRRNP